MKRAFSLFLSLLTFTTLEASFQGTYVEANAGGAFYEVDMHARYLAIPFTLLPVGVPASNTTTASHDARIGDWKGWFELAAGWGCFMCDNVYLGGRLGINFSSQNVRRRVTDISDVSNSPFFGQAILTEKVTFSSGVAEFSADLKPGYCFTPCTLGYGIIGVALNQEKLQGTIDQTVSQTNLPPVLSSGLTVTKRRLAPALRVGLGLEEQFGQCWAFNAMYVFTYYQRLKAEGTAAALAATPLVGLPPVLLTNGLQNRVQARPRKHVFALGLKRYF